MKRYRITYSRRDREYTSEGTLPELRDAFRYTLEKGASWQHEKGRKKINIHPATIGSLVQNLYNAENNAAADGYSGFWFEYEEIL